MLKGGGGESLGTLLSPTRPLTSVQPLRTHGFGRYRCQPHHDFFGCASLTRPASVPTHGLQNIGQMLRTHFQKSQFIVVSLKDGMFNNANVLFKTKFIDGVSAVRRYAQSQVG